MKCPKCNSNNTIINEKEVSKYDKRIRCCCEDCGYFQEFYSNTLKNHYLIEGVEIRDE